MTAFKRYACLVTVLIVSVPARSEEPDRQQILALSKHIDALIAAKQKEAGVIPAPRADDSTYFRRLNLDLVGRIPKLTEHWDLLQDENPAKRWEWVERFLAADSYKYADEIEKRDLTEKYARHFANIWRTQMLGSNLSPQLAGLAVGFEAWLAEQLKVNKGYDAIVREILTAAPNNAAMQAGAGGINASPVAFFFVNENKPENLAAATTRTFLGVKLECAQCHAHPFAKWAREQFWEFAAFFDGTQVGPVRGGLQPPPAATGARGRSIQIPGTDKRVKAKFLSGQEPAWKENDQPRTVLANWITSPDNPYFARAAVDQVWSYFFGVSLLEPILEPSDDSPVTHPELLDELARQFVAHKYDLKFLISAIVHTDAYQRCSTGATKASKEDYNLFVRMPVRGLTPEQIFDSIAEATHYEPAIATMPSPQPFRNQAFSPRGQFLAKFTTQDRRHETQTSILQALFLMNGSFLAERTRLDANLSLQALLQSRDGAGQPHSTGRRLQTLFVWVLSRLPRPDELERLVPYVDGGGATGDPRQAMADVYWALLNSGEFLLNH